LEETLVVRSGVEILKEHDRADEILTPEALDFVAALHRQFNPRREELLRKRAERQADFDEGRMPIFPPETESVRNGNWLVAAAPGDLQDRRVEITGPVDRKMMINALNSGANVFMADIEDSLSPTWDNIVQGQINLRDAVRRTIRLDDAAKNKTYRLHDHVATLVVRPRGWHLTEKHVSVDGESISASLFDFGLYLFHNAAELTARNSGPYFYLPKLESRLEARLWNDVFNAAQDALVVPRGTIRATVLIETILAAFEMDEILYELREHASGHNAGRWDYIFSMIKKFRNRSDMLLPDRAQVGMTVPFMRAYAELLVQTCHRRGAHAIGGMAAFIPSRKDAAVNEAALAKVTEDKRREAGQGFDGTWVAHPDLVPVAKHAFDEVLGERPHQKENLRTDVTVNTDDLLRTNVPDGAITEYGVRNNVSIALQYLNSWLLGNGAAAIFNLMEDAATAEISRAQLWQCIRNKATLNDGRIVSRELYGQIVDEETGNLGGVGTGRYRESKEILNALVLGDDFIEFLTLPAYEYLG
jgi:malate synthase